MNYAILLSGGIGNRINSDVPKQYVSLGKHMMITYSLATLFSCMDVKKIVIVADIAWRSQIVREIKDIPGSGKVLEFADPGETRQLSVFNALKLITELKGDSTEADEDTVLVHDAARPYVSPVLIRSLYDALPGHDGVMPVLPMKDTVYRSENGESISGLLDRKGLFAGQAPELFKLDSYIKANEALLPDKILSINGASEPAFLAGMNIKMVPGDETNTKVTTDEDLKKAMEYFR